ncbi:MAG: hypothetical protein JWP02_1451 [Acidimicrobiales bacterium]|nr:hypothetical protein [Acidimicrobiales bacterium]
MKRLIGLLAALTALAALVAGPASAINLSSNPDRDTTPACADIKDGRADMSGEEGGPYTVTFDELLFRTACPLVDYQFVVTNPATGVVLATVTPTAGDGSEAAPLHYSASVNDAGAAHFTDSDGVHAEVCVYAQTALAGQMLDRGPDAGCNSMAVPPIPPGTRFR